MLAKPIEVPIKIFHWPINSIGLYVRLFSVLRVMMKDAFVVSYLNPLSKYYSL